MHTRHVMGVLVILAAATTALAGPLATDGNAYNDGNGPDDGAWRGTTRMESGPLVADVDFCVYGPGDYTGSYEAAGNEFVYAYQAYVLDEAALSKLSVGMLESNEANDISHDSSVLSGVAPFGWDFTKEMDQAYWDFTGLAKNTHSDALVYSSVNAPISFFGTITNWGETGGGVLPSPGDVIPEPASLGLLAIGLALLARKRR